MRKPLLPGSFFKQDSPGPQYDLSYDFPALRRSASELLPQFGKLGLGHPAGLGSLGIACPTGTLLTGNSGGWIPSLNHNLFCMFLYTRVCISNLPAFSSCVSAQVGEKAEALRALLDRWALPLTPPL